MTPINIYAELTPNPNSMKFVANINLLEGGVVEYDSKEAAVNCPMAVSLFSFSGINKVFITTNFITLNKESDVDWFDVTNIIREFIRGYLMSGEPLFIGSPFDENHVPASTKKVEVKVSEVATETKERPTIPSSPELEKKITELLEEYVKPAVESDGGAIHFKSFENGTVSVVLKGACSGCPSSTVTLKSGIENLLKQMLPEVHEVIAVAE
jgi:Fe-S cluster biogenesis protein NfuA